MSKNSNFPKTKSFVVGCSRLFVIEGFAPLFLLLSIFDSILVLVVSNSVGLDQIDKVRGCLILKVLWFKIRGIVEVRD